VTVDAPPAAADPGGGGRRGFVESDLGEGELFLAGAHHRVYRLAWIAGEKDRRRALPPGTYKLTGYRLVRADREGTRWFISTTSHGFRDVVVEAGKPTRVAIDPAIRITTRASLAADGLGGQMGIQAEPHVGLSIYRAGKRIPIDYRALDGDGRVLARGTMTYG
jgi:hypothetical protein